MAKTVYTAEAHVTGGREHGHGTTNDGRLDVQLRPPTDDAEQGTNPEQLFAVGYAACFEGALGAVSRREKVELGDVAIDSSVSLITTEDRGYNVAVKLDVSPARHLRRRAGQGDRGRRPQGVPVLQCHARERRRRADRQRAAGLAEIDDPDGKSAR